MLFESDPGKISGNIENEDIIQMDPVTQRILNYPAGNIMPYINQDGLGELYGAIYLHMRPLIMVISRKRGGGGEIIQHKNRPVSFTITLRYQLT